jgi:nicotinamide riboside kinase
MAIKIAIMGTHGTGKTTLSYKLAAHYKERGKNVKIVQEVARSCPFPINEGMTKDAAYWIYHEHSKKELEAKEKHDVVISDRSFLDYFLYAKYFKLEIDAYPDHQLRQYDHIYFVRPDIPLVSDGVRSSDLDFQRVMDQIFQEELKKISYLELKSSQIFDKEDSWKRFCL